MDTNQNAVLEHAINYWSKHLHNWVFTEIPKWNTIGSKSKKDFNYKQVVLSTELNEKIIGLSHKLQIPLAHIGLAAHIKVLSVLAGNLDITTGKQDKNEIIPFRCKVASGSWKELIVDVANKDTESNTFKKVSFSEIENQLNLSSTLFETTFSYIESSTKGNEAKALANKKVQKDLKLSVEINYNAEEKITTLNLCYNAVALPLEQLENIVQYYINALQLMTEDVDALHHKQSILS